jgi:threonine aldolase
MGAIKLKHIDMRSDTVTQPTDEMREAMYRAEVGDDVYGDDPTVKKLEEYAASLVGKEAALFVPSGTFGNQLAIFTHCARGNEVILGDDCHIVVHEAGAASVIAGVQLRTLQSLNGELNPEEIKSKIRLTNDIHSPETGLICLENAHSNGRVIPLENMRKIRNISVENGVPVHLDGARLFNASAWLNVDAREIASMCDSVMFCLSKGLCAPVGSILAGDKKFIECALRKRKLMGGGMRQAGFLAAAGLVALEKMRLRLDEDNRHAALLAKLLSQIPGVKVNIEDVHINMVYADIKGTGCDETLIADMLCKRGIKINPPENGIIRFVTHYWIGENEIKSAAEAVRDIL